MTGFNTKFDELVGGLDTYYGKLEAIMMAAVNFAKYNPKRILYMAGHSDSEEEFYEDCVLSLHSKTSLYGSSNDLTIDCGKLEAIRIFTDEFDDFAEYKPIDPKHILTLAKHYEDKDDFYTCLVLGLYSEAYSLYESSGESDTAREVLKQRDEVKRRIRDKYCEAKLSDIELAELCALKERRLQDEQVDMVEESHKILAGYVSEMNKYNRILAEWSVIPNIYLELRQKYHLPIKYIEEAILEIMNGDRPLPVGCVETVKARASKYCDRQGPHVSVNSIMRDVEGILDGGINNFAKKYGHWDIHLFESHLNLDFEDSVRAFEEVGAFWRAARMARDSDNTSYDSKSMERIYSELADFLSLPA